MDILKKLNRSYAVGFDCVPLALFSKSMIRDPTEKIMYWSGAEVMDLDAAKKLITSNARNELSEIKSEYSLLLHLLIRFGKHAKVNFAGWQQQLKNDFVRATSYTDHSRHDNQLNGNRDDLAVTDPGLRGPLWHESVKNFRLNSVLTVHPVHRTRIFPKVDLSFLRRQRRWHLIYHRLNFDMGPGVTGYRFDFLKVSTNCLKARPDLHLPKFSGSLYLHTGKVVVSSSDVKKLPFTRGDLTNNPAACSHLEVGTVYR